MFPVPMFPLGFPGALGRPPNSCSHVPIGFPKRPKTIVPMCSHVPSSANISNIMLTWAGPDSWRASPSQVAARAPRLPSGVVGRQNFAKILSLPNPRIDHLTLWYSLGVTKFTRMMNNWWSDAMRKHCVKTLNKESGQLHSLM